MKRIRLKTPERIRLKRSHTAQRKSPITKAEKEALRMLENRDDERIEDGRGRKRSASKTRERRTPRLVLYCLHNDETTVWLLRAEYTDKKNVPRELYIRDRWAEHL